MWFLQRANLVPKKPLSVKNGSGVKFQSSTRAGCGAGDVLVGGSLAALDWMGSGRCFGDNGTAQGPGGDGGGEGRATAEEQQCGLWSALEMLTLSWHHGSQLCLAALSGYRLPEPTTSHFPTSSAILLLFTSFLF